MTGDDGLGQVNVTEVIRSHGQIMDVSGGRNGGFCW